MAKMKTVTREELRELAKTLAEEEKARQKIAKRKRNAERSSYSYLWVIPLGKINQASYRVLEIKSDGREAILRAQKAFSIAFREDWTEIKLGKKNKEEGRDGKQSDEKSFDV